MKVHRIALVGLCLTASLLGGADVWGITKAWSNEQDLTLDNPVYSGIGHYEYPGSSDNDDIGMDFVNCSNVTINNPTVTNCGYAGIRLRNCTNVHINGGHITGTAPGAGGNYQFGIDD